MEARLSLGNRREKEENRSHEIRNLGFESPDFSNLVFELLPQFLDLLLRPSVIPSYAIDFEIESEPVGIRVLSLTPQRIVGLLQRFKIVFPGRQERP